MANKQNTTERTITEQEQGYEAGTIGGYKYQIEKSRNTTYISVSYEFMNVSAIVRDDCSEIAYSMSGGGRTREQLDHVKRLIDICVILAEEVRE